MNHKRIIKGADKMVEQKSVWNDISKVWGRIAAVLVAVGVIATFITKVFNTPPEITYSVFAGLGITLLLISFYVDKQAEYTHNELAAHIKDSTNIRNEITSSLKDLKEITLDTRKDTIRIQLLMVMKDQPDNIDTILKLAETYFVKLEGDWYMTNEFNKWAKKHDVVVPINIITAINDNHKDN
jgi:hypothetical protein